MDARDRKGAPKRAVLPPVVLAVAIAAFAATAWWLSERIGVWSEEVATYPAGPGRALVGPPGEPPQLVSCEGEPRLRESDHRPELALCAAGRTWPVMAAPYMSGWPYWPLGGLLPYDAFLYRKLGILLGALTLLLGFFVASRATDRWVAAAGAAAAALSSPFVLAHGLLVHFELAPLPLVALAAWVSQRARGDGGAEPRRMAVIGVLLGLAVAINIKALFLIGALALFAWRTDRLPRPRGTGAASFAFAVALPLVPMIAYALLDERGGFSEQIGYRVRNVALRLTSPSTLLEPLNVLTYWTDVAAYGEQAVGSWRAPHLWPLVLPAIALGRITFHFVRALAKRPHDAFAGALGALVCCYLLAAALLYDQQPAANYAPLHVVFGFATGSTAVAIARWFAKRLELSARTEAGLGVALVALAVAGAAFHVFRRGDPASFPISTNAEAQRGAVAHLEAHPGGTPVTASYNLAGVLDAVSGGRIAAVHVGEYVTACRADASEEERRDCVEDRWAAVVARAGRVRLVIPAESALSDEDELSLQVPALEALAARGAIRLEREARFGGVGTPPLLDVWDVRPR